jgi:hypothetical protein
VGAEVVSKRAGHAAGVKRSRRVEDCAAMEKEVKTVEVAHCVIVRQHAAEDVVARRCAKCEILHECVENYVGLRTTFGQGSGATSEQHGQELL